MTTYPKTCPTCERNFNAKYDKAIYCSRKCAVTGFWGDDEEFKPPTARAEIRYLLRTYADINGGKLPHGCLTDISIRVGLTRERVRQIAEKEGYEEIMKLAAAKIDKAKCAYCGKEYSRRSKNTIYCSAECRGERFKKKFTATTNCLICNKEIGYYAVNRDRKPKYCSYICHGSAMSKGWHVRTDLTQKVDMLYGTTFTAKQLAAILEITPGNAHVKIRRLIKTGFVSQIGKNERGRKQYTVIKKSNKPY